MSSYGEFKVRKAERDAICRCCDYTIKKGEKMLSGYSIRGRGQHIHFHLTCVEEMNKLVQESKELDR